jgi:CheY-like chemotaxis protein
VVSNLFNNAAKYTPEGGRGELSVECHAQQAVIRVRDNGMGIPAEMLPKVFDIFTQVGRATDRAQGGLGIGLSLVKRLVEMHGGTVEAASEGVGRGSTFSVSLPRLMETATDLPAPRGETEPPPSAGSRILVVDDNIDGAETLAMLLEGSGHAVRTAYSGPAALQQARAFQPELVLLDLGLPGMNGFEVARELRADPAYGAPVLVALTGWGSEEDRRRSREAGFSEHLTKPADVKDVRELITRLTRVSG